MLTGGLCRLFGRNVHALVGRGRSRANGALGGNPHPSLEIGSEMLVGGDVSSCHARQSAETTE